MSGAERLLIALLLVSWDGSNSQQEGEREAKLHVEVLLKPGQCSEYSAMGDNLKIHYTGRLDDGTMFDNSLVRDPLDVQLGRKQVIPGKFTVGLLLTCREKRRLMIPSHLAYGKRGLPPSIPGDAALVFEVELVSLLKQTYWKKKLNEVVPLASIVLIPGLLCLIAYYLYTKATATKVSKKKLKEEKRSKLKKK
uniref:peptidylprolyl isomerase n=1 Tax=Callorhinchus milii TaxID=7868 RepID=A0A4W3IBH2_CALMI